MTNKETDFIFEATQLTIENQAPINRNVESPEDVDIRSFIISNEIEDRHKAIIEKDKWRLKHFNDLNPIVTLNHNDSSHDIFQAIGKGKAYHDTKNLNCDVTFNTKGKGDLFNKTAANVVYMLDNNFLNMSSVRLYPFKWGYGDSTKGENPDTFYFRDQDLLALSIVFVPANPTTRQKNTFDKFLKSLSNAEYFINESKNKDFVVEVNKELKDEDINPDKGDLHINNAKTLLTISRQILRLRS